MGFFQPKPQLDEHDIERAQKYLLWEGLTAQFMGVLTTGAFLVAFTLMLGGGNKAVGLIAAIAPLAQILQIPAIYVVNWLGHRRMVVVFVALIGRLFWFVIAALPWIVTDQARIPVLLLSLAGFFCCSSFAGCAFNSWLRDVIPEKIMGKFFARRMGYATALGAAVSIAGGVAVDQYTEHFENALGIYSILFTIGGIVGVIGVVWLAKTPEPKLEPTPHMHIFKLLGEPFRDPNFRKLLIFLGVWSFAVNLAAPFFTVYILERLDMSMTWVLGLAVVSQLFNVAFIFLWGGLADRFTNKSVLTVSGPLFIVSFLFWPFTTMPERYVLTIPLLIGIHVLAGISTAGVSLCAGNLALKTAPYGRATAYLAVNALVSGLAATVAPILAGFTADALMTQELSINLHYGSTMVSEGGVDLLAINLRGLDFLFLLAFVVGLYALHRLLAIQEEGEVEEQIIVREVFTEVRKVAMSVSNVAGLRHLTYFPYALLQEGLRRIR